MKISSGDMNTSFGRELAGGSGDKGEGKERSWGTGGCVLLVLEEE